MRLISRTIFREIFVSAMLGAALFAFVLFLRLAGPLFEFLVRSSGPVKTVAYLFALELPIPLPYAIPLGVLIGTLITLSRMSADGEITAMRAAGVPGWQVIPAILGFGFLAMCVAACASLWLAPWAQREGLRVRNLLIANELTADVQPRVFEEQFPNKIIYVGDVITGPVSRWRQIFIADTTPPAERPASATERGDNPIITLAREAIAVPDAAANRLQLTVNSESTYETGKNPDEYHIQVSGSGDETLYAEKPKPVTIKPVVQIDTRPLFKLAYRTAGLDKTTLLDARIELHQRFALPLACVLLALAGIPLGISSRRAGKSGAVVLTVALALIYNVMMIACSKLAQSNTLSPGVAMWIPNSLFAVFGLAMISRLESPGDHDPIGAFFQYFRALGKSASEKATGRTRWVARRIHWPRFHIVPQVIDRYVLTSFLFYFVLLLISFVIVFHIFEFFTLLSDIIKNGIAFPRILAYHFFLSPRLIYDFSPIAVLTAVLVVFAILSKHNEITAFKASGISAHRLSVPILIASLGLSGSLFAFDYFWVPSADKLQDAIRNEIKGKPPQTYMHVDHRWINGENNRIFYYEYLDPTERVMSNVNVYEIDPGPYRLKKHIFAKRARWEPVPQRWVFQDGWSADIDGTRTTKWDSFVVQEFPEITEKLDYFLREEHRARQMNFWELQSYIAGLQQSGFDTTSLQVQLNKKFSVPLFALIMAMVSIPFAFIAGNRGAMAGVGMSLVLAIAYESLDKLFEQVGALGQLQPPLAAWSPDVIFLLTGLYFLVRMRT